MKAILKYSTMLLLMVFSINSMANISAIYTENEEPTDTTKYKVYTGKVIDAEDKDVLPFATIESEDLNYATVTNMDGEFILKIPKEKQIKNIKISYVGYKNQTVNIVNSKEGKGVLIKLQPSSVNLDAVTIRAEKADELISEILANISKNYSKEDMMMTAFYRETVKRRRNYVSISEAVVDIFKSSYNSSFKYDQVKLLQGRKSADVEKMDTVLFKVQGGPVTTLLLDIVKNPYILLSDEYLKVYNFFITDIIAINDRLHYVISFNQKQHVTIPYYDGKLYVDMEKLAISETEFSLNMDNEYEVARMFIRKKPMGMSVIPEKALYKAKYTIKDDTWYFSYARAEAKFDVDWDKKLFKTSYTTMSEIAITERSGKAAEKFSNKERYKRSHVLDDLVYVFFDQDFWGGYNLIEPDQSIESAIKKLNRKYKKAEESKEVQP